MSEEMREWSISPPLIIGLRMCKNGEAAVREDREKEGEEGEVEIQIRILYLLLPLNLYGEMSRHFNGRWLFRALSRYRLEPLGAS